MYPVVGLYSVRFHISVHHGIDSQPGHGLDTQLLGDILAVGDDGGQADVQFVGNLLVDETFGNQHQHFYFAAGGRSCPAAVFIAISECLAGAGFPWFCLYWFPYWRSCRMFFARFCSS